MRNYATSCLPCIRKNSTRWRKFWRLNDNDSPSAYFPESAVASRSGCGTLLGDAPFHREAYARRNWRAGSSVEGLSANGDAWGRPVRARRAQVRKRQAPRRVRPRRQDFRDDSGAGQFARGSRILRTKNQDRSAADQRRSAHQDDLSRGREELVSQQQALLMVRQLRHWDALRRADNRAQQFWKR